ncbi:YihY/virulence factor BrkB family protein [Anaeromicropila herbilytica]|uniref:YihY family inner membrane protein n=1 Tax=Anaeromicropila herbilytica TaxID=2785025 RepID=A0A7R7IBN2_9FIRM|nr:YihY/virulence factor BrkB family protein [Anaeromicropila herbilytica]BCN29823.1 hypothetical protein bsdtb5_11180 [Anaeromicropila herbilytica]
MIRLNKIYSTIINFLNKMKEDHVSAYSANATLFIIISFFPFVMFLLTLLQFVPMSESTILHSFSTVAPIKITSFLVVLVSDMYSRSTTTIISVTAITALWSASKGFMALIKGLNSVYGIDETRNYFKLRFISAIYTVVFAFMLIITLVILVFGNRLYIWIVTKVPMLNNLAIVVISLRTFVGLLVLTLFFLLLYNVMPDRTSRILAELPGAVIAASGWMLFSYLFSYYIDNMGNFSYIYGSLTAVVLLMLWLYFCMYILFIGAEINVFLLSNRKYVKWMQNR